MQSATCTVHASYTTTQRSGQREQRAQGQPDADDGSGAHSLLCGIAAAGSDFLLASAQGQCLVNQMLGLAAGNAEVFLQGFGRRLTIALPGIADHAGAIAEAAALE